MPNEAPGDASAARGTRELFAISITFINLFSIGCRQFAAYAAVWREQAPFSSALSIKLVCLVRVFILLCDREHGAFYPRL